MCCHLVKRSIVSEFVDAAPAHRKVLPPGANFVMLSSKQVFLPADSTHRPQRCMRACDLATCARYTVCAHASYALSSTCTHRSGRASRRRPPFVAAPTRWRAPAVWSCGIIVSRKTCGTSTSSSTLTAMGRRPAVVAVTTRVGHTGTSTRTLPTYITTQRSTAASCVSSHPTTCSSRRLSSDRFYRAPLSASVGRCGTTSSS